MTKNKWCAFKIDIHKAYETILGLYGSNLGRMNFLEKRRRMIMQCLSIVSYTLLHQIKNSWTEIFLLNQVADPSNPTKFLLFPMKRSKKELNWIIIWSKWRRSKSKYFCYLFRSLIILTWALVLVCCFLIPKIGFLFPTKQKPFIHLSTCNG